MMFDLDPWRMVLPPYCPNRSGVEKGVILDHAQMKALCLYWGKVYLYTESLSSFNPVSIFCGVTFTVIEKLTSRAGSSIYHIYHDSDHV